jgi:hypothetical protein
MLEEEEEDDESFFPVFCLDLTVDEDEDGEGEMSLPKNEKVGLDATTSDDVSSEEDE